MEHWNIEHRTIEHQNIENLNIRKAISISFGWAWSEMSMAIQFMRP